VQGGERDGDHPAENCPSTNHYDPAPLPDAVVGEDYEVVLTDYISPLWGGIPYTMAELPAGLEIVNHHSLTGTPAESGMYEVVVSIGDHTPPPHCSGLISTHPLTLLVHEAGGGSTTSTGTSGTSTTDGGSSG